MTAKQLSACLAMTCAGAALTQEGKSPLVDARKHYRVSTANDLLTADLRSPNGQGDVTAHGAGGMELLETHSETAFSLVQKNPLQRLPVGEGTATGPTTYDHETGSASDPGSYRLR